MNLRKVGKVDGQNSKQEGTALWISHRQVCRTGGTSIIFNPMFEDSFYLQELIVNKRAGKMGKLGIGLPLIWLTYHQNVQEMPCAVHYHGIVKNLRRIYNIDTTGTGPHRWSEHAEKSNLQYDT